MKWRSLAYAGVAVICFLGAVGLWHVLGGRDYSGSNVILISIDTLRADHLGCYGYGVETTPYIDSLAADGIRFTNAFSQSSWTLPSHMSIMTSLYPSVHGVGPSQRALADTVIALAEVLSNNGYDTAGFVSWVFVGKSWGFGQGFDSFAELWGAPDKPDNPAGGAFPAEQVTDHALQWIRDRGSSSPFFLFVHYFDPHMNYSPPPPYDSIFDPDYSGSGSGEWSWIKPHIRWSNADPTSIGERDLRHITALYDGEIRYVDHQIQRLLETLNRSVDLKDCLIVITSDHGEEFNDHGSMEGHGWTLYDEILHVPLIVLLPGRGESETVLDSPVGLIDIAPTLLGLLGMEIPPGFQGKDHSDLIRGVDAGKEKRFLFSETYRFNHKLSVRGPRYKLVHTEDTGVGRGGVVWSEDWELFDLQKDPGEQVNLFDGNLPIRRLLVGGIRRFKSSRQGVRRLGKPVEIPDQDLKLLRSLGYVE